MVIGNTPPGALPLFSLTLMCWWLVEGFIHKTSLQQKSGLRRRSLISVLDWKAIQFTLSTFLPRILGELVILMNNNATVVAYLKQQGGMVFRVMHSLPQETMAWTELHSVTLPTRCIPWKNNITDQLSCADHVLPTERSLPPWVFSIIFKVFVILTWNCLLLEQTWSFFYMCLQFQIPWHESKLLFNIPGTISLLMGLPSSL